MNSQIQTTSLLIFFCLHFFFLNAQSESTKPNNVLPPYDLRCEYLKDPLGIDMKSPRFFWKLKGNSSSHFQSAYQIVISPNIENLKKGNTNFFYRYLAGINFNSDSPGFKEIIFKPNFVEGIKHVSAKYNSINGEILSEWKISENGKYSFHFSVPSNCSARVVIEGKERRYGPGNHVLSYLKNK